MATYKFGVPPFMTNIFTSPFAGTNDSISALTAADFTINGNGGNDQVATASGNDTITTAAGNDSIKAGDGNNTVNAGSGTNSVTAGSGNDTVTTGSGTDVIKAGDGNNTVDAGDGTNNVTTGSGNDTITTGAGIDRIKAGEGNDIIVAGAGNDKIDAGAGDDSINAGQGDDTVIAGAGTDTIIGGGGHDTFKYQSLSDALSGLDTISDFSTASPVLAGEGDVLKLNGLVGDFTGAGYATLAKLVASGHLSFSGDSESTVISFDSNGDTAGGDVGVLVNLTGVPFTTEANAVIAFEDNIAF